MTTAKQLIEELIEAKNPPLISASGKSGEFMKKYLSKLLDGSGVEYSTKKSPVGGTLQVVADDSKDQKTVDQAVVNTEIAWHKEQGKDDAWLKKNRPGLKYKKL